MRIPSADTLQKRLQIDRPLALRLRRVLDGRLDPLEVLGSDSWTICLRGIDAKLEAANKLLGGCGIESIVGEWRHNYYCDSQAVYVNMGDGYTGTLLYDRDEGWQVTDWATWVEHLERKGKLV